MIRSTGIKKTIILIITTLSLFTCISMAKNDRVIIVAMHIEPPFSDIVDGEFVGEHIEVAKALAAKTNMTTRFVYCPVARCFSLVESGQADMIVAVKKTAIREKFLSYLSPAIKIQKLPLRFYIGTNNNFTLDKYNDLDTLKIGVLRGASYFDKFDHDTTISKIPLTTHQQLIDMLLKGRIDTFLEREESITPLVEKSVYSTKIKLAKFSYAKGVGSYVAISKKSSLVTETSNLSKSMRALHESGELYKIIGSSKKFIN